MKNIQNKLIKTLDKCKYCGRTWDEYGNRIKLSNFNYKINYEFICEDCQKDFYKRGWKDVKTYSVKMG